VLPLTVAGAPEVHTGAPDVHTGAPDIKTTIHAAPSHVSSPAILCVSRLARARGRRDGPPNGTDLARHGGAEAERAVRRAP